MFVRQVITAGVVCFTLFATTGACSSTMTTVGTVPDGQQCTTSAQCLGRYCREGICRTTCSPSVACPDGKTCYHAADGQFFCQTACTWAGSGTVFGAVSGDACVDGATYLCSEVPDGSITCGCGCATNEYCAKVDGGTACTPRIAAGAPCDAASFFACDTGYCRPPASTAPPGTRGRCEVPPNAECTSLNCSECVSTGSSGSHCIERCGTGLPSCPSLPTATECIVSGAAAYCVPRCLSGSCPSGMSCQQVSGYSYSVCIWPNWP